MAQLASKIGVNPWLLAIIVSMATFMEVLDTTITNVSLSHIAGTLGAGTDESTWVLTSYLVSNGIVLPLSGWLSDKIGQKKFFLICIAGFTAASFACGAATSLGMLIFFRLIQGLAGGGLQPTQQAIILDLFPPEKRGAVFGITGITLVLAPIIGPTLGGWITDNYSWRWIFFINIPVGIMVFMLVATLLPASKMLHAGKRTMDFIGLILIAVGLGCLQIVLDKGQQDDWFGSSFIVWMSVICAVSLIGAVVWLLNHKDPLVDLRLLKIPSFGIAWVLIFFTGFVLYASNALLPLLLQTNFGYDATSAGMVLSPGGIAIVMFMVLSGKLVGKFPARNLIILGLSLMTLGMLNSMITINPYMSYNNFVVVRVIQVLGLPFLFIPVSAMAFSNIPPGKNNQASALFALSRNLGGSFGISLMLTYITRQAQTNQANLTRHLIPTDPVFQGQVAAIARRIIDAGGNATNATNQAMGRIYQELLSQASIMSYQHAFGLMAAIMCCGIVLACFLPAKKGGKAPAGAH